MHPPVGPAAESRPRSTWIESPAATSRRAVSGTLGRVVTQLTRAIALCAAASLLGGCFSHRGAWSARTELAIAPFADDPWPARDPTAVESFRAATPHEIHVYELATDTPPDSLDPHVRRLGEEPYRVVLFNEIVGGGLLRVYGPAQGEDDRAAWDKLLYGFVPNATLLSEFEVASPRFQEKLASQAADGTNRSLLPIGSARFITPTGLQPVPAAPMMLDEGIQLRVPDVDGPHARAAS